MIFRDILLVFVGSGIGGVLRWGIGIGVINFFGAQKFPIATLTANFIACALTACLAGLSLRGNCELSTELRLFFITGFLGGLGTMSAFGLETVFLLKRGSWGFAGFNIALTLAICLGVVWLIIRKCEAL